MNRWWWCPIAKILREKYRWTFQELGDLFDVSPNTVSRTINPKERKKINQTEKTRYHTDPSYKEKKKQQAMERYWKMKSDA